MKTPIVLSLSQIRQLVEKNKYKIDRQKQFLSRCIDDRYQDEKSLSPLAIPGADAGQLAIIFAAGNKFGFKINNEIAFEALVDIVGGLKKLHFHTDNHFHEKTIGGCGHFKQITLDPGSYHLDRKQIDFINKKADKAVAMGATHKILYGDHNQGAVLKIRGNYNIYPSYFLETEKGKKRVGFFALHETLIRKRHLALAALLIYKKAIGQTKQNNSNYLYKTLNKMAGLHISQTLKRLATGLPIYRVTFFKDGSLTSYQNVMGIDLWMNGMKTRNKQPNYHRLKATGMGFAVKKMGMMK